MKDNMVCSRKKRMLSFLIDRLIIYSIVILIMCYSPYITLFCNYITYIQERNFVLSISYTILLLLLGYLIILCIYFINFILLQYFFNLTPGKWLMKIQLVKLENNQLVKPTFLDLLKRFFYLYLSGLGALGYLYLFSKKNKSKYDDAIQMYVIDKDKL